MPSSIQSSNFLAVSNRQGHLRLAASAFFLTKPQVVPITSKIQRGEEDTLIERTANTVLPDFSIMHLNHEDILDIGYA
jgi:hypothetical protein